MPGLKRLRPQGLAAAISRLRSYKENVMQLNINDMLLKRAQQVSGLQSAQAVIEAALRVLIAQRHQDAPETGRAENPLKLLLESDFIGCADSDETRLSQTYKNELTGILEKKYGYR
ncbi:MAG: type II toxin-antitoxin system VapB family antitoxin [Candidatus Electrothrix aestuarii]|uniref:Type II toxin-antitoxin system VapB family antitoxin n=1 Tax=Candidatus Electrothrix aestuarii TaxID=3062594 RepID=A0AAU8LXW5_9BACT|nr:type II toxin-antitoxin system VapB family antitoxin [Candidatus Electrothrix aestuarii]